MFMVLSLFIYLFILMVIIQQKIYQLNLILHPMWTSFTFTIDRNIWQEHHISIAKELK